MTTERTKTGTKALMDCMITQSMRIAARRARMGCFMLTTIYMTGCIDMNGARKSNTQSSPLGSISDSIWTNQEQNGEASEFVVYAHEFELRGGRLTLDGEDHLQNIATRLLEGTESVVVVERSMNGNRAGRFNYPVNADPELDDLRRRVVVSVLAELGISNSDEIVVVAPVFSAPLSSQEAETAYYRMFGNSNSGNSFGSGTGGAFGGGNGMGGGGFVGSGAASMDSSGIAKD